MVTAMITETQRWSQTPTETKKLFQRWAQRSRDGHKDVQAQRGFKLLQRPKSGDANGRKNNRRGPHVIHKKNHKSQQIPTQITAKMFTDALG